MRKELVKGSRIYTLFILFITLTHLQNLGITNSDVIILNHIASLIPHGLFLDVKLLKHFICIYEFKTVVLITHFY